MLTVTAICRRCLRKICGWSSRRLVLTVLFCLSVLFLCPTIFHTPHVRAPSLVLQTAPSTTNETLEQALMRRADSRGYIILASVDYGYVDLALNLYESSFKKFSLVNFLFVSSDERATEVLTSRGIATFTSYIDKDGGQSSAYLTEAFARKTHYKTKIVLDALKLGLTVLLTDVDVVFLKDPFPYLDCVQCDLQISSDVVEANSGFYLARPTKAAIELHQRAWDGGMENPEKSNQKQIVSVLESMNKWGTITMKSLSPEMFPCGVVYFDDAQRMFAGDNPCKDCVIVHNNWIVSGRGKAYRFKEHLMWYLDEGGYYSDPRRRYLTYSNPRDFGPQHNLLIETQALRVALIVAHILNRTLILPAFHCDPCKEGPCNNPGKRCALNTFYKIEDFDKAFDGVYREQMFLRHVKVPDRVKESQSDVLFIRGDQDIVHQESDTLHLMPSHSNEGVQRHELRSWLSTLGIMYSHTSVLHFHSLYCNCTSLLEEEIDANFRSKLDTAFSRATYRQFAIQ